MPFCEPCAREQEAYFTVGELTEEPRSPYDDDRLVGMLHRMRGQHDVAGFAHLAPTRPKAVWSQKVGAEGSRCSLPRVSSRIDTCPTRAGMSASCFAKRPMHDCSPRA